MKTTIETKDMLNYLQSQLTRWMEETEKYGHNEYTDRHISAAIACKEMVEALIEYPVNLQKDGKVTVGF